MHYLKTAFLMLLALLVLPACIASKAPGTKFYILSSMQDDGTLPDANGAKGNISVQISSIHLPQYLDRPQLVTRTDGNQLEMEEFHQWGGNLKGDMMTLIASNLSEMLRTPNVATSYRRLPGNKIYKVDMEIMKFERDGAMKVHLIAQWSILLVRQGGAKEINITEGWSISRGGKRKLLVTKITELTSKPVVEKKDSMEQTVTAMSKLLNNLSREIGKEILRHSRRVIH